MGYFTKTPSWIKMMTSSIQPFSRNQGLKVVVCFLILYAPLWFGGFETLKQLNHECNRALCILKVSFFVVQLRIMIFVLRKCAHSFVMCKQTAFIVNLLHVWKQGLSARNSERAVAELYSRSLTSRLYNCNIWFGLYSRHCLQRPRHPLQLLLW